MERRVWLQALGESNCPAWLCPECHKGHTRLVKDSLSYKETVASKQAHEEDGFDFDWIEYVFTAWAQCSNTSCGQEFAISGTGGVEPEYISEHEWEYTAYFAPKICSPMPDIFTLPEKCPEDIARELRFAFRIFWSNQSGCANRIRIALEYLMDHLGIPSRKTKGEDKEVVLTLHDRIDAYAKVEPAYGAQLMALKWLGNAGSHRGDIHKTDLLDAFEILEYALAQIIGGQAVRVAALAEKLALKHAKKAN